MGHHVTGEASSFRKDKEALPRCSSAAGLGKRRQAPVSALTAPRSQRFISPPPMSTPRKKTPCIHYARGSCKNGAKCTFSHSSAGASSPFSSPSPTRHAGVSPVSKPCIFHAQGICRYGETCRDSHVPASPTTSPSPRTPTKSPTVRFGMGGPPSSPLQTSPFGPCKFFTRGFCKEGGNCPFPHIGNPEPAPSRIPCKFFAAGSCTMGPICVFEHVITTRPTVETPPSPTQIIRAVRKAPIRHASHYLLSTRPLRRCRSNLHRRSRPHPP